MAGWDSGGQGMMTAFAVKPLRESQSQCHWESDLWCLSWVVVMWESWGSADH